MLLSFSGSARSANFSFAGSIGCDWAARSLELYLACIERTNWSEVPLSRFTGSSCAPSIHDISLERTENTGGILWIEPTPLWSWMEVLLNAASLRPFAFVPRVTGGGACDDTHLWTRCYYCGRSSATFGSHTILFPTNVIIVYDSDFAKDDPISLVCRNHAGMASKNVEGTSKYFSCFEIGVRLASTWFPHGSDWDICGRVQMRDRTKFLESTAACVHVFFDEAAVPPRKRFLYDCYKLRS